MLKMEKDQWKCMEKHEDGYRRIIYSREKLEMT